MLYATSLLLHSLIYLFSLLSSLLAFCGSLTFIIAALCFCPCQLHTGCASDDKAFQMISWQGRQAIDRWYVPDSYTYPAMSWADPTVVPVSATGGVAGSMTVMNLTGNTIIGRKGTGITSGYLQYDLTDGEPLNEEETIVYVSGLTTKHLVYAEKSDVGGVATNTFLYEYPDNFTVAEDEVRQRTGQMPHAHMQNLRHSKGIAAIASLPNFFGVDTDIYSQSSNTDKYAAAGGGVSLYRTRDGYSPSSALLSTFEVMTGESVAELKGEMMGFTKIEPASGVALNTRAQSMGSGFTWNCNPQLDATCGLLASAHNTSDPLCYAGNGIQMPCSNANVFTPRVRGGKVLPLFWSRAHLNAGDDVVDIFLMAMDTRLALGVMSLVLPLLFLLCFALLRPACCCPQRGDAKVAAAPEIYSAGNNAEEGRAEVEMDTAKLMQ